jgi:ubiquinone/menaquinone biosynthesis C-methylase UbiE
VQADPEALPFGKGQFDVVTSCFGAMFAPDHQAVADELLRVCRPGGTIGMINFTPQGLGGEFFEAFARYAPPPPGALPRSCGGTTSTCASSSANGWTRSS